MYDFHSHILPNLDDGSKSIKESIGMLKNLKDSNIKAVVATPHYHINNHDIDEFLNYREKSYQMLINNIDTNEYPKIIKGAEVMLTTELADIKDLHRLCIENTNYILLEMPYSYWTDWVYHAVYKISSEHNLIPIIAHIDRYITMMKNKDKISELLSLEVVAQINASAIIERSTQRASLKMIKQGIIHVIGSDAHDDKDKLSNIGEAYRIIRKKLKEGKIIELENIAKSILNI